MTHLSLRLLGPFQAMLGDEEITSFRSNKVRALLAYLAVESQRSHRRESLAGLLWPDWPESYARGSLRSALNNLRQVIGDQEADPPFLLTTHDTIQFNTASDHSLDVAAFEALATRGDGEGAIRALEEAVELYHGDLLEGFSIPDGEALDEWAAPKREHYRRCMQDALHRLTDHHTGAGDPRRAEGYARRCLALEPWDEAAHRGLMRALAFGGQRNAALAHYDACRDALAQGLGVEPAPETTALYEQIRDGTLLPPAGQPAMTTAVPPGIAARRAPAAIERPLFVGREGEMDQLEGFLGAALGRRGRVVFVSGEAGSGKTALVEAFCDRCMETFDDLVVATGRCNAMTGVGDPYLPFIEVLQMLVGDIEPQWLGGTVTQEHARRLWALLPNTGSALLQCGQELIGRFVSAETLLSTLHTYAVGADTIVAQVGAAVQRRAARVTPELPQTHLFEQYTRVIQAVSQARPLILVLDDLQWADAGSIGLLFHLGRRLQGFPILIIGTYRPEDVALGRDGARHPLESVIAELQRVQGPISVDLDKADGRAFLDALLASEPNRLGPSFHEMLYLCAEGQPLFTLEFLRGLQERGDLMKDEQGRWVEGPRLDWSVLPPRAEAVIAERIARLAPELGDTLTAACIEGETFTAQVVAQVQGVDEREVVALLSGPLSKEHHLVVAQSMVNVGGRLLYRYRFHHHLLHAYLHDRLDPIESAYLHGQVGDILQSLYRAEPGGLANIAPRLGLHYREAGRMAEASRYLHMAGVEAVRLSAPQEALRYFAQALELDQGAWDKILADRAPFYLGLFRGGDAAQDYQRLLDHARSTGDRHSELEAMLGLGRANYILSLDAKDSAFIARSRDLYHAAYALARELGDKAGMARALIATQWFPDFWPEYQARAVAQIEEGRALAQELGDRELIADSTMALARFRNLPEILELGEELLIRLLEDRDLTRANALLFLLMWGHCERGNFERCIQRCDDGIALAAEIGAPPVQYPTIKALALVPLGRFAEAWAAIQEEVSDDEHPFGRVFQKLGIAAYLMALRAWEQAAETLRELGEEGLRMGRAWLKLWGQTSLARCLVRTEHPDPAELQEIAGDLSSIEDYPWANIEGEASLALGEIALREGRTGEARESAQRAAAKMAASGRLPMQAGALELAARTLLRAGKPGEALAAAEEGIALAEGISSVTLLWRLDTQKGRALEALGRSEEAAQAYASAAAILRQLAQAIPDAELKAGFLADPEVAAVLVKEP